MSLARILNHSAALCSAGPSVGFPTRLNCMQPVVFISFEVKDQMWPTWITSEAAVLSECKWRSPEVCGPYFAQNLTVVPPGYVSSPQGCGRLLFSCFASNYDVKTKILTKKNIYIHVCCGQSCCAYLKEVACLHSNLPFQLFNDRITIMKKHLWIY